jgi:hypothetical protein
VGYIAYPGKQLLQQAGADTSLEEQLLKVSQQTASAEPGQKCTYIS